MGFGSPDASYQARMTVVYTFSLKVRCGNTPSIKKRPNINRF